jgi:hypothetical protein
MMALAGIPPQKNELRLFDKQDIKLVVTCNVPDNFDGAIIFDNNAIVYPLQQQVHLQLNFLHLQNPMMTTGWLSNSYQS